MAMRHRWPGRLDRGDVVARDRRRAGRQQITRRRRRGTVMRHSFSLPCPITVRTVGMLPPTPSGPLVASARVPQALTTGLPRAAASAVDLTAVATATDDHLVAAPLAQEQTGRDRLTLPVVADAA
jgi:hypothetical protein